MTNEHITCGWIPALPALIIDRITEEDTLPGLGLEGVALVLLHMGIGPAAKDMVFNCRRLHRVFCLRQQRRGRG